MADNELITADATQLPMVAPEGVDGMKAAVDLRSALMLLPKEQANQVLAEYKDRRHNFRAWLKEQLREGIHYGFPPGTVPVSDVRNDGTYYQIWIRGGNQWVHERYWTPKPSLYKAGADFLCDLLAARDEYRADLEGWTQLGSPPGTFVYACYLKSRATDELIGEGRGCRSVGDKKGDANNAIKMAKKCAKVDAVLNTWGLADLFTQDLEDAPPPPVANANADRNADAPRTQPRAQRQKPVTKEEVMQLYKEWCIANPGEQLPTAFPDFIFAKTGREFNAKATAEWTRDDLNRCFRALGIGEE